MTLTFFFNEINYKPMQELNPSTPHLMTPPGCLRSDQTVNGALLVLRNYSQFAVAIRLFFHMYKREKKEEKAATYRMT